MLDFDVVVIGAGISGMTAAIYLKRANVNVCIVEKNAPGGQLNMINEISNYPGFNKIDGPSLAFNVFNQVRDLKITYKYGNVKEIVNNNDMKIVKLGDEELKCKSVIIANGRRPKELGLSNEKKLLGRGISYCSICDGSLYENKNVCVVGGGNSAVSSALYLSNICSKVYLIHKRNDFRSEKCNLDEIKKRTNVKLVLDTTITSINETDDKVSSIELSNGKTIDCSCIFVNIGNVPIPIKCENLEVDNGYIVVDNKMKTNISNIYACGDIVKKDVYQITTAVGEGTVAAMSALSELDV